MAMKQADQSTKKGASASFPIVVPCSTSTCCTHLHCLHHLHSLHCLHRRRFRHQRCCLAAAAQWEQLSQCRRRFCQRLWPVRRPSQSHCPLPVDTHGFSCQQNKTSCALHEQGALKRACMNTGCGYGSLLEKASTNPKCCTAGASAATVAWLTTEPLGSIISGRCKPEIAEQF
jgi:hypothetical protein